jgi:hypothetical protein
MLHYCKVKGERMLQNVHSKVYVPSATHDASMTRLNELRNKFIHFLPQSWTLQLSYVSAVLSDCINLPRFLVQQSGNISWRTPELEERYARAFTSCESAFHQLQEQQSRTPPPEQI